MKFPLHRQKLVAHYSPKIFAFASVLLLLLSWTHNASAAGEYSVENVVVDAGGKDATDARTKALASGEKDAFAQLVLRLHPANSADIFKQVTPSQISNMVRGYSVVDEKMTADHYHATLNYNFDPKQIEALIPPAPVASTTAAPAPPQTAATPGTPATPPAPANASKAVLVLPVYNAGGGLELWQDENKWRSLWYEAALEAGGGLVVVPQGDLNDRVDVDDTNVTAATPESLRRMYARYGVGEIIVLQAFYNEKADPKPALEVTVKKLLPGKPETSLMTYTILSTENLDTLMARASNDIARNLYKQQTIDPNKIEYDRLKEITARVNTTSIKEWEELRKRLLARGNIVGIRLDSISYYETTMTITFKGTPDMLGKTLVISGLRVMQDGDSLVLAIK